VSVALPPRRKTDSVRNEIAAGLDPDSLAFGRRTRTTDKFHAQFKTVLTDIESIAIAPVEGAPQHKVLVVRLRQGGVPAMSLTGMTPRAAELLGLQLHEIWWHSTQKFRRWQEHYGAEGLLALSPGEFERVVEHVFASSGGSVTRTGSSGDGGIDVEVIHQGKLLVVQCKRFRTAVGPGHVRELLGTVNARGADHGILVSTSGFTDGARRFAADHPLTLLDSDGLADLAQTLDPSTRAEGDTPTQHDWPQPDALGPWVSLTSSATTPHFAVRRPRSAMRLALVGIGTGLGYGFIFLVFIAIWAFTSRGTLAIAALAAGIAVACAWGIKNAWDDDATRTTECAACGHGSVAHRLEAFSPYRLLLTCGSCQQCHHLLPETSSDARPGSIRPLLYIRPQADGVVSIERLDHGRPTVVTRLDYKGANGHVFLTDVAGQRGSSQYRFRFEPISSPASTAGTPAVDSPPTPQVLSSEADVTTPDRKCPKCRKRLRLARRWEDGSGHWACYQCGYSANLSDP
jgi:Zn ribbon nucleic-acid-binding protein